MDGMINVQDIILMVNIALGSNPSSEEFEAADLNDDGVIDVIDIVQLVNIILN